VFSNSSYHAASSTLNKTCTYMPQILVSFVASVPGTVIVTATVTITLNHAAGVLTAAALFIGNSTTSCPSNGPVSYAIVSGTVATGTYYTTVAMVNMFAVPSAGTYSYYITGYDYSGGTDTTQFGWASAVGAFYPS
jgi:hypothetical protein